MADPDPATLAAKTILQSLTVKGAMAMALAFVAAKLGVDIDDSAVHGLAEALVNLVFYGGLLAVGVGRARARGPLS